MNPRDVLIESFKERALVISTTCLAAKKGKRDAAEEMERAAFRFAHYSQVAEREPRLMKLAVEELARKLAEPPPPPELGDTRTTRELVEGFESRHPK